jgi:chromate transporter
VKVLRHSRLRGNDDNEINQMMNPHPTPKSPLDLFVSFTLIAIQGFGGVMAIIQRELVEKKQWMTKDEFVEEWAVAQIMPGPNVINLALILGARYFGLRGAFAALAGMLLVPLIIVLTLGVLYSEFSTHSGVAGATRGMSAVAAGLIIATGMKLFAGLKSNPLGKTKCIIFGALCFFCIALLHWPLLSVLLLLGPLACLLAYRGLKP